MTPEEKEQILKELGGIPEDTYNELIKELIPTLKDQIAQIKALKEKNDMAELGEVAHSVKGSAGNFRLRKVYELALSVEKNAKANGQEGDLDSQITELEQALLDFDKNF